MTSLGPFGEWSVLYINDHGQIVGSRYTPTGEPRAFIWQNGVRTDLPTLGGNNSYVTSINEQGQIVGASTTASGEGHAVLWTISQPTTTPREQIQAVKAQVKQLRTSKTLNKGQSNALMTKLDSALAKLERGNKKAAANQLHAFVNQVQAFHHGKKITTAQAQPLLDKAHNIIGQLSR